MDKNSIKKFAVWARCELIRRVTEKALQYGITAERYGNPDADSIGGRLLSDTEKKQREALISDINKKGFNLVMEEAACTWFNRFTAIRFMEVNGYLPSRVHVFTDADNNFKPQILTEAIDLDLDGLDTKKVYELKNANKAEELFRYLIIAQCSSFSKILPGMFQKTDHYTELLMPDYLLHEGSVIQQMIELIPEEDWRDHVQIIGWLYQYYNTELKDNVFADLKKNVKITKENIPVATQLFTPDWIVRYMVENSLGRLWLEGHPNDRLKAEWKYYLDEAEQEAAVQTQLDEIQKEYAALTPEEIMCIDPSMGSGHILCYLFDVLIRIYEEYGYTSREAVPLIIEKNLWGLDIDERAEQLAYFSVMMKAVQYDKRFLNQKNIPQPHVYSPKGDPDGEKFGSLLIVDESEPVSGERIENHEKQLNRWNFRRTLAQRYHVVVTNPPYIGASNMNAELSSFIKKNFADYKSDCFSAFLARCSQIALPNGKLGFFSPYVWMFIKSYEKLRRLLCQQKTIETLIQFEYSAFEEATVPVCAFVFSNYHINRKGCYFRLTDFRGGMEVQRQKTLEAIANHNCGYYYKQSSDNFSKIPGSPMAYWLTNNAFSAFSYGTLNKIVTASVGIQTGDNEKFVHFWWEIIYQEICFSARVCEDTYQDRKWFPYNKGGEYRKWSGNDYHVVLWKNDGEEVKLNSILFGRHYQQYSDELKFRPLITWSRITSGTPAFRYKPSGYLSDMAGFCLYTKGTDLKFVIALCNSAVADYYLAVLAPTLNIMTGQVLALPFNPEIINKTALVYNVDSCIELVKKDWDSFETSWNFTHHPLVRRGAAVKDAYAAWEAECAERFNQLKANEEEINRLFIEIYGLQDELTPDVEDKDVTVRKADIKRDIRGLISYAVGCMFGRYSLDVDGLAYAGGEWDSAKYKTFQPYKDAIIPISGDEYFEDDIVSRFVDFIEAAYGKETLEENLQFIADALGGKGKNPGTVIRNYFINGFYADHCKIYKKRPIYWLFDSGKKNGFKCLIYIHRYQPDTIARIRTGYVHKQQARYHTAIANLENQLGRAPVSERGKLAKRLHKMQTQAGNVRVYEEKIHCLADQMIRIRLDDGIKHNYEIFKDVLAKIK